MSKLVLQNIRLITFDVTGTLLKFRNSPGREYASIGNLYGVQCDENELNGTIKASIKQLSKEEPNFGKYSGLGWEKWWHKIIVNSFKNHTTDEEVLEAISKDLIAIYKTPLCWKHTFGTIDLLDALSAKGIKLGVISNFDPRLSILLKNLKINHYFEFIVNSFDADCEKPDVRIFQLASALSKIPNLCAMESLHIGNSPELDYHAAINAGWTSALIAKELPEDYPDVPEHAIFASLSHLKKQLFLEEESQSTI